MTLPRLLYCSPVMPALGGNGLAMRAGTVLCALAERYRVSLLVVPRYWSPAAELPERIARRCQQVVVASGGVPGPRRPATATTSRTSGFGDEPFDVVHVFRLATVDDIRPWLDVSGGRPSRHLDLDDVESITRSRIADLYERNGRPEQARIERAAADRAVISEQVLLHDFDRVYVCSDGDRTALESRRLGAAAARIDVLPNALPLPEPLGPPPSDQPFTFLFIGTLSYYPNEDAIVSFCQTVLPSLRRMATGPFRVAIVGIGMTPAIQDLAAIPEVDVIGAVEDVADAYRHANAAIVPIRAGGGTRIKVLEAFAYRRPVVATTIGAEGIVARHGEHLLIADEPADIARQCARLIASSGLAARLATRAEALFRSDYACDALRHRVLALP